jgi:ribosomal protein L37AE/L43A
MGIETTSSGLRLNFTKCPLCGDESKHPQAYEGNKHAWQCRECSAVFTTEGHVLGQ